MSNEISQAFLLIIRSKVTLYNFCHSAAFMLNQMGHFSCIKSKVRIENLHIITSTKLFS